MQPPETEPTTMPSARIAMVAPSGRGLEPQVRTTVTYSQAWPSRRHCTHACNTSISMLSIVVLTESKCATVQTRGHIHNPRAVV